MYFTVVLITVIRRKGEKKRSRRKLMSSVRETGKKQSSKPGSELRNSSLIPVNYLRCSLPTWLAVMGREAERVR